MNTGIYALVNKANGKMYIGQRRNLEKRKITHLWMLREDRHFNIHLQRAWNKGDRFEFKILELCKASELNLKEKLWYDIVRLRRWKHLPNTIKELEEMRWKQETLAQGR